MNFQNVKIELFYFSNETSLEKKLNFTSKLEYLLKRKLCFMKLFFRIHYPYQLLPSPSELWMLPITAFFEKNNSFKLSILKNDSFLNGLQLCSWISIVLFVGINPFRTGGWGGGTVYHPLGIFFITQKVSKTSTSFFLTFNKMELSIFCQKIKVIGLIWAFSRPFLSKEKMLFLGLKCNSL